MGDQPADRPAPPDLPAYVLNPLERQSSDRLERVASYAQELAAWKRAQHERETAQRQAAEAISDDERTALANRDISTDPADYEDVPSGAYITIKTTKQTSDRAYRYYYWQWREGETWENQYIGPVGSEPDS
ncbi:hypothetical protein ACFPYI_21700 [Halomarina salina]|uniref:Uncharacterized protein n=1 Tax=Halomarina salina TaxID=1872699 RepID=A0ABD5RTM1_9EURY|nr:hypothetical protein [Halomarina salina]